MRFRGINHIVLKVRDLAAPDSFYGGVLGLKRAGERPGMVFYTAGAHHHDLALIEVGRRAASPGLRSFSAGDPGHSQTGLFHFCLDVPDEAALAEVYHRCLTQNVPVLGTADHTIMRSFYVRDPDGHVVEIGFDVPKEEWASLPDPFRADRPYTPPVKP